VTEFHQKVPVDGIWLDMNEPTSLCDGECNMTKSATVKRQMQNFDPNNPPYVIGNRRDENGTAYPLDKKTLAVDAKLHSGAVMYDVHNVYGEA